MSWTDKMALETIHQLKREFGIKTFVETGTYMGINAKVQARHFDNVCTCESNGEFFETARKKLEDCPNVTLRQQSSPDFLKWFRDEHEKTGNKEMVFIYLDAHFYNPEIPKEKRFVILDELKALEGFKKGVIAIHDFDNGELGHITYDGIPLNFELLEKDLRKINPDFRYYTNCRAGCSIFTERTIAELIDDPDALDNIRYANSSDEKRYRGILYCVPRDLDLNVYKLRKME